MVPFWTVWDRQKRWELKRDALSDAVSKISAVEDALTRLQSVYRTPHGEGEMADESAEFNHAANDLERAILLVNLVCGDQLALLLSQFSVLARNIAVDMHEGKPEPLTARRKEFATALIPS